MSEIRTILYRLTLASAVCVFGVVALLSMPPLQAAQAKKRVHTTYGPKAAVNTSIRIPARRDKLEVAVNGSPNLRSAFALVVDFNDGRTIYAKNVHSVAPIASITKLMTAMVLLDADLSLEETIYIDVADLDFLKHTHSRLAIGTGLSRRDMLRLALMSSENRAASAIGRSYPGGQEEFIAAMNKKALDLGMSNTRFVDTTGLSSENVSTASDLAKMVKAAFQYPLIREFTTTSSHDIETASGRNLIFRNSNGLVKSAAWEIGLSKTGYINEAGRCLVMQAQIAARSVVIVLLDSWGKYTRTADANRIKKWLESP